MRFAFAPVSAATPRLAKSIRPLQWRSEFAVCEVDVQHAAMVWGRCRRRRVKQQRSHENGVSDFANEWNPLRGFHDRINLRFGYSTGKMGFRNYTEWSVFNSAII